jgi:hypothetical protein
MDIYAVLTHCRVRRYFSPAIFSAGERLTSERLVCTAAAWADIATILAAIKHKAGRPPEQRARLFIELSTTSHALAP